MGFSKDFIWGAATSAYQIEGSLGDNNKGLNIWDIFCKQPGKVYGAQTGEIACDHYHLYKKDIAIMKEIGLKAYRFSIDWSRVLPSGTGKVNPTGIEFYNNLVDSLLEAGIEPVITMYHWEMPYEIYKKGGWLNDNCVEWFGEYAKLIAETFSDRVKYFITLNEPQTFINLGYVTGVHAPGLKLSMKDTLQMSHNVMKAHGRAVQNLRAFAKQPIKIGYAPCGEFSYPLTNKPADIEAARRLSFDVNPDDNDWAWNIAWWSDPVMLGHYPESALVRYEKDLPKITAEDLKLISEPIDIYCQNIYHGKPTIMNEAGNPEHVNFPAGSPITDMNWPITPESIYWGPKFLYERYKKPIMITENGLSTHDFISLDNKVHDHDRMNFLHRYLNELKKVADEIELIGYFQWSLLDNFEWACGYEERFGLVYTDYKTQERTIKDSAYWYKKVIDTNGESL